MDQKKAKSISTKKGDSGGTSLFDGARVSKASLRPQTYGTLDEASAFIGLARAKATNPVLKEALLKVQNMIYLVNAELACPAESKDKLPKRFTKKYMESFEEETKTVENSLVLPGKFIVYGETEVGAILDIARAVVRRAERTLKLLDEVESIGNTEVKPFINRLSDYLYLLARLNEKEAGLSPRIVD